MNEIKETFLVRATAHARASAALHPGQRFRNGVTDVAVAGVFLALEAYGATFRRTPTGQWRTASTQCRPAIHGVDLSVTIREMIRTGLVRMAETSEGAVIIPARVHLGDTSRTDSTACLAPVEGMKEGRVRTVDDLALVDCLECEASVVRGAPRGL